MSKCPDRSVSLPRDQPTRYFAWGEVRDSLGVSSCSSFWYYSIAIVIVVVDASCRSEDTPSSSSGRAARYDALERTCARRRANSEGRSLTTIIPKDEGPKASVRVSNETVPVFHQYYIS